MRERVRRETWNRDGKPPILIPIAKCKKCGSWVDLPNVKVERCANSAYALAICSPVDAEKGAELRHRIAAEQDIAFMREIDDQANTRLDWQDESKGG